MNSIENKHVALVYDTLYKMADNLFKNYNPCQHDNEGNCVGTRAGRGKCCNEECKYISNNGCTTQNLACKLWICEILRKEKPELYNMLIEIRELAFLYMNHVPFFYSRERSIEINLSRVQ